MVARREGIRAFISLHHTNRMLHACFNQPQQLGRGQGFCSRLMLQGKAPVLPSEVAPEPTKQGHDS